MRSKKRLITIVLVLGFLLSVSVTLVSAADPPQPTYASATVDGLTGEWNTNDPTSDPNSDFFANMYKAANSGFDSLSKLYLRYDCSTETVYALVVTKDGYHIDTVDNDGIDNDDFDNHFVKVGTTKLVDANDYPPDSSLPEFAWVGLSADETTAQGWEASASLARGTYTDFNVHTNVTTEQNPSQEDDYETSAVEGRAIDLELLCMDFGDLPGLYPLTLLTDEGARHTIGDLYLGLSVDAETDGQPQSNALGDDNDGNDDEDGVERDPNDLWQKGETVGLNVVVSGTNGYLVCWIDWDRSDAFETDEMIEFGDVNAGSQTLALTIPSDYNTGDDLFARCRLFDGDPGDPEPTGLADNGEVEDYFWGFGTTAVTLVSLEGRSGSGFPALAAAMVFLAGTVAVGGVLVRRRQS